MNIITISRHSRILGTEFAEMVAEKLDYRCVSREILIEASAQYDTPEIKLINAIEKPPSIFDRMTYGKEKYIAYIESALLKNVREGNVVYHGLVGHIFLRNISHALKLRITADMKNRIKIYMSQTGCNNIDAVKEIEKIDKARHKWAQSLYGIDIGDATLYDLVINLSNISMDEAVDIACNLAQSKSFQSTPESHLELENLYLASQVKIALFDNWPEVEVMAKEGAVRIQLIDDNLFEDEDQRHETTEKIESLVHDISGVKTINIDTSSY